ncbi:MAG: dehydrogenase [Cyclobacteriaceae bacterium]|nr:MAG: dehydrogenase [Cyclobacteriaceae bacterium]
MRNLVIGGGSIGKRHIRNLHNLGYRDIVCLKRENDLEFASEQQVDVVTEYPNEPGKIPDVVFVCTPTSLHNQGLKLAVASGAHIFMEKPLVDSRHALNTAKRLLSKYRKVFFIGFMLRYHPLIQEMKRILNQGLIGKIYYARFEFGSYLPYWHPNEDYKIGYAARSELGGGVVNTITHELDLILYFFGVPQNLMCRKSNFNILEIEVEEQAEAVLDYPDLQVSLHLDYLQKDYSRIIKVLGTEGRLAWNWEDQFLEFKQHNQPVRRVQLPQTFDINQMYVDQLEHFFRLIANNRIEHPLDANLAISNAEVMLLMHDSHKRNRVVNIAINNS